MLKKCLLVVMGFLFAAFVNASESKVYDFSRAEEWSVTNKKSADVSLGYQFDTGRNEEVLTVKYVFKPSDKQRSFVIAPKSPKTFTTIDAVKLWFKGDGSESYMAVWLKDSKGEIFVHGRKFSVSTPKWEAMTRSYKGKSTHHWGGNDDEVMDAPLTVMHIMVMNNDKDKVTGNLRIGGLSVIDLSKKEENGDAQAPSVSKEETETVSCEFKEVGRFVPVTPEEDVRLSCLIVNKADKPRKFELALRRKLLLESKEEKKLVVELAAGEKKTVTLPFDFKTCGVHEVKADLEEGGAGLVSIGTHVNVWHPVGNKWNDDPVTFFGGMESLDSGAMYKMRDHDLELMSRCGVKVVRFILRWRAIEPRKGEYHWQAYDEIMKSCRKHNIIPYPFLCRAPKWAVEEKNLKLSHHRHVLDWNPKLDDYCDFVRAAVNRYKGYTKYWQVWNEPYARHYFAGGEAEDYGRMLKAAYEVIKEVDPDAKVNTGSFHMTRYAKKALKASEGKFDNWPFHCHGSVGLMKECVRKWKKFLGKDYESSVIWCDESGYAVDPRVDYSELDKAATVLKKITYARYAGLGNYTWFIFRHQIKSTTTPRDNYPALDYQGRVRPVVLAHNTVATYLKQTKFIKEIDLGGQGDAYMFSDGKRNVIVFWSGKYILGKIVKFKFPKGASAPELYNMLGTKKEAGFHDNTLVCPLVNSPLFMVLPKNVEPESVKVESVLDLVPRVLVKRGEGGTCEFVIRNICMEPMTATVNVKNAGGWNVASDIASIVLPPHKSQKVRLTFTPEKSVKDNVVVPLVVKLGQEMVINVDLKVISCLPLQKITDETKGPKQMLADMNSEVFVQDLKVGEADADLHWQGLDDLSAKIYGGWDDKNLYVKVDVKDNVHHQKSEVQSLWNGDSIQIALTASPANERTDIQLVMALLDNKPVLYTCIGAFKKPPEYSVKRKGERTVYEIAILWSELSVKAKKNRVFLMSVLVNDNDGHGRKIIMEWGLGIHGTQASALFKPMILK